MSPVGKEKVCGENDLPKSQVLSSEWKTERVREDASGDSEDANTANPEKTAKNSSVTFLLHLVYMVSGVFEWYIVTINRYF